MKVHIIGLPGSGKTTLASWVSEAVGVPAFDLDWLVYDRATGERTASEIDERVEEIRRLDGWVTEGAYQDLWLAPLLDGADAIVWLDCAVVTCGFRMIKRHVLAELAGTNQHRGWRKLAGFLNYGRRSAARQRAATRRLLAVYGAKSWRCRSSSDIAKFKESITRAQGGRS